MQVFHIWQLVTPCGERLYLQSLVAEAVSEAWQRQALPLASMFAGPGSSKAPSLVSREDAGGGCQCLWGLFVGAA